MIRLQGDQLETIFAGVLAGLRSRQVAKEARASIDAVRRVRNALAQLGLCRTFRKVWTAAEVETLQRDYLRRPTAEIAAELGRPINKVYAKAANLGLAQPNRVDWSVADVELRRLNAEGYSDQEIADHLCEQLERFIDRRTVSDRRGKLKLPSNAFSERFRKRVAAKTRERCAAAGVPDLCHLRLKGWREKIAAMGWPSDLRPRCAQMLNALYRHGPMTRRQLAEEIGMPWKGPRQSLQSNAPEGTYLWELVNRGLVVRLPRLVKSSADGSTGKGKGQHLYALALGVAPQPQAERAG